MKSEDIVEPKEIAIVLREDQDRGAAMSIHDRLPCGCVPDSPHHTGKHGNCKLTATSAFGSPPRPAVIAMFEQLNELWHIAHPAYERNEQNG